MDSFFLVLFFLLKVVISNCEVNITVDFGTDGFSITELISDFGYPVESHINIETEDGYLLDMHRIPHGKDGNNNGSRPAALLMHGILGSAENWIISGPDKGLAFLLADSGYDVWLGNARGTAHSRKHRSLSPDNDGEYWQFSWHEIGVYDLPAKIDYILEETNQTDLFYVGHSQGTTTFFVMTSERPSYNSKIKLMAALAPAAFMSNVPHLGVQITALFQESLQFFTNIIGLNEFVPNNELIKLAGSAVCQDRAVVRELCANILFLIAGYDSQQLDRSLLPLISQTTPAGASVKQFVHFGQEIRSDFPTTICKTFNRGPISRYLFELVGLEKCTQHGKFQHFDYGLDNLDIYGTSTPPPYDLSQISTPVALFYAANDWLVSTDDVERLSAELPNLVLKYLVPYPEFNHLDFIFAKDIKPLLNDQIISLMNEYRLF